LAILTSINIGQAQTIPTKKAKTGIYKMPVAAAVVTNLGLDGDAVLDRKHHGGVDQAIYLYFEDDYQFWRKELDAEVRPGTFGENITIDDVTGMDVAVGDRFTIGPVLLEVTSHRTPCMTLALRMGDPKFLKRFHKSGRSGAYCRVITPGNITSSDPVTYQPFAGPRITVAQLMAQDGNRNIDPDFMRRALEAPVHHKMRTDYENRLARLF
jgi:MOSC domain-containing protein YiiM